MAKYICQGFVPELSRADHNGAVVLDSVSPITQISYYNRDM